jgi:hypothetical protein
MRPAIYLRRPQGAPTAVEFLAVPPGQCGLFLGTHSVLAIFGGKEIPIEGTFGEAVTEFSDSLRVHSYVDSVQDIKDRFRSLLIPRAEKIYLLGNNRHKIGQLTCVYENLTIGHGSNIRNEDNILVLPLNVPTEDEAMDQILEFLMNNSVRRYL